MSSNQQLQPGQVLGAYTIVRRVGRGGMGEVYEATDKELQRKVAIKILYESSLSNQVAVERFRLEGRTLARLKHPNVVTLHGIGETGPHKYMVMEYLDGHPLDHFLLSYPCGLAETIDLMRQMAEGLAAAHDAGIIHRDLKPSNIVVDRGLHAKIIDFGIAKLPSEESSVNTTANMVIGTVNYLAPDVVVGKPASVLSDVYSLGLVFYHMLTSETPFSGRTNLEVLENIRTRPLTFSSALQLLIPEEVRDVILRMTHKVPNSRYQQADDVARDLTKIDLSHLPKDLRLPSRGLPRVVNAAEVRKRCDLDGFDSCEFPFVLNIAANLQLKNSVEISKQSRPTIDVSSWAITEAFERFLSARSDLKVAVAEKSRAQAPAKEGPKTTKRKRRLVSRIRATYVSGWNWRGLASTMGTLMVAYMAYSWISLKVAARQPASAAAPAVIDSSNPSLSAAISSAMSPLTGGTAGAQLVHVPSVTGLTPHAVQAPLGSIPEVNVHQGFHFDLKPCSLGESLTLTATAPHRPPSTRTYRRVLGSQHQPLWLNSKGGFERWTNNPFLPPTKKAKLLNEGSPLFPLELNKGTWYRLQEGEAEYTMFCQVQGQRRVKVAAGTFETVRIECSRTYLNKSRSLSQAKPGLDVFYFAPQIHHWVLHEQSPSGLREELVQHNIH